MSYLKDYRSIYPALSWISSENGSRIIKQIEVVAAIIHDDEDCIFATQRGYCDMKDGWEFPDTEGVWHLCVLDTLNGVGQRMM